jgi:glutamate-1-semialdehyde 2,1-aminomutase
VTEAGATNAIIRAFGSKKVMYGSDWPVAEGRGKCISLGESFIWITPHNIDLVARYTKEGLVCPALDIQVTLTPPCVFCWRSSI